MSPGLSQKGRVASFRTPLGDDAFVVTRFEASEGLSEMFLFRVDAVSLNENADLSRMLGEKCTVDYSLRGGETRHFNGVLTEARWLGTSGRYYLYSFVLKPWLWLLSQRADCRIFSNKTAPDIIAEIFDKEGKKDFKRLLSDQYQKMVYCVQYRETDLAFVTRLMEQHGIYYYFKHTRDGHTLILSDSKSSHDLQRAPAERTAGAGQARPGQQNGAYPFLPRGRPDRRVSDHLIEWRAERRLSTGRVELDDYDYKQSTSDLRQFKEDGIEAAKRYEVYDYPGKYTERGDGRRFAEVRVQAKQALDDRRYADGEAPSLFPGALCNLAGHLSPSEDGEYLVVGATHAFQAQSYESGAEPAPEDPYRGSYAFLRGDKRFRAVVVTPKPLIFGPQTAKVVGENRKEGEEIDVDEYGCILVQFHWDRGDKTTSRRVRVAQVWSGKAWGGQVIPRIGQEVVVEFLEGDPDQPLVIGTVYNDQHKHPYDLPDNKTQSGLKSNSSKGGGGYNEVRFEDKKGAEVVTVHAERDLDSVIRRAETREVGEIFKPPQGEAARRTTIKNGDDVLDVESGSLLVEAKVSIVLKVGQSTITIEPNTITIDAPTVKVKSVNTEIKADATVAVTGQMITLN